MLLVRQHRGGDSVGTEAGVTAEYTAVILVLRGLGTRVVGHYNGGKHCLVHGQLDFQFVGGGAILWTAKLPHKAPRGEGGAVGVSGNHNTAITCVRRLLLIRNEVDNVIDV